MDALQAAIDKRDAFLKEHPELAEYQKEIRSRLLKAGNIENRIEVLKFMLEERVLALEKIAKDSHEELS